MVALPGKFFPRGHKCLNCTSAGKGIEQGSGLLVTCESMGTPEVTAHETLAQKVMFHHGEVSVPATSCTAAHLLLSRHTWGCSRQQNRAHRDQLQNYLQITSQIKQLVCFVVFFSSFFFLTAFFASKVEHESKHCNGKGIQRPGSSAFDRVYTAK